MKTRHLFLLASAVALFTNCMQDEIDVPLTTGTVVAVMEDDATKTNVDENFAFTWTTGDKIAIHTTDSNLEGTLKGEGGSTNGTFNYSYTGNAPELSGYATYPYHDGHKVVNNELTFVLPATYTLTSLSNTNAPMIAVPTQRATSEAEADYDFKHIAGVFRFVFNNPPADANKFTLTLGGKKINGTFTATIGNETTLVTGEAADGESTTTLEFAVPEGAKSITLYVPVPTGNYEGITATMYADEEVLGTWGKATARNTVVRRSVILMAPITFSTAEGDIQNNVNVATEKQLVEAVAKGGTITLTEDITIATKLSIVHNTTIIGGGHTLTYTGADRAIDVPSSSQVDFTVKNLNVYCSASYCERGLNYNASKNFILENVTIAGKNLNYSVNLPGSSDNANVAISNSSLTSNLALNVWGENVTVTVNDSHLTSLDRSEAENYAAIVFNNDGATCAQGSKITVEGGSIIAKDENGAPSIAVLNPALADVTISETTEVVGSRKDAVAVVLYEGQTQFYSCYSIEDAIAEAMEDKTGKASVKLLADVNAAGLITIPADKALVLDLNGHAFAYTSAVAGDAMITNNGTLTVKDSGLNGKITYSYTGTPDTSYGKGNYTIFNKGTLTLESGIVENTTAAMSHASYAINTDTGATVTINGGKVLNLNAHSIRMTSFATGANKVTVNGGYVEGTRAIQLHLPGSNSSSAPEMSLAINGGELKSNENVYNMAVYLTSSGQSCENVSINVTGGTLNGNIALAKLATNSLQDNAVKISGGVLNGPWGIYSWATDDVAKNKINITGGTFASMMPLAYMTDGEKADFKLMEDYVAYEGLDIPKGVDVKVDLNGNDISYAVDNDGKASAIFKNNGTLTLVNSASAESMISFIANDPDLQQVPSYATNTISNFGTLTIGRNVVVTNESEGGASYAVDNHAYFTLDGGTLLGKRCALRIAKFNPPYVSFTMNSGLVKAATPAWIHLPGSDSAVAPSIDVNIKGGKFETTKESSKDNNIFYTYSYGNSHANTKITISGGEFVGGTVSIGSGYKGDSPTLNITGGSFDYDVLQWLENDESKVLYEANMN